MKSSVGSKTTMVGVLILVGLLLVLFHQPIIQFVTQTFAPKDTRKILGMLEAFHGDVEIKLPENMDSQKPSKNAPLRHQDTLIVNQGSQAIVRMKNGMVLEIDALSSLFFEQLDYTLISIQRGNLKVIEKGGGDHEVILLKDGRLQDPEGRNIAPSSLLKAETVGDDDEPATTPVPQAANEKSLSDAYISSIVQNQKGFMNRCYAQHLRNQPQSKGEMHLTFTIQPGGDVTSLKVLKSTIDDSELQRCVLSTLERARFRAFEGDPIVVNYPIFFE